MTVPRPRPSFLPSWVVGTARHRHSRTFTKELTVCGPPASGPPSPVQLWGQWLDSRRTVPTQSFRPGAQSRKHRRVPQLRAPAQRAQPGPACQGQGQCAGPSTDACLQPTRPGSRASVLLGLPLSGWLLRATCLASRKHRLQGTLSATCRNPLLPCFHPFTALHLLHHQQNGPGSHHR